MKLVKDEVISNLIRLTACALIWVAGYWLPFFLDWLFRDIGDTRFGMALCSGFPFLVGAAVWSAWVFGRLLDLTKNRNGREAYRIRIVGALLLAPCVLGVGMIVLDLLLVILAVYQSS